MKLGPPSSEILRRFMKYFRYLRTKLLSLSSWLNMAAGESRSAQLLPSDVESTLDGTAMLSDDGNAIAMTQITTTGFSVIDIDPDIGPDTEHRAATPPAPHSETYSDPKPLQRSRSFSDILSQSAPVLLIKEHGRKMTSREYPAEWEDRDRSWTSWVVGLSCGCFLFPSFTILAFRMWNSVRWWIIFDCIYFVVVTIFSFLNDYVYCYVKNPPCNVVFIDQWTATGGVVIAAINIFVNPYPLMLRLLDIVVTLFALFFIGKSRRAENGKEWRKWHCLWHLAAGSGLAYIYIQEYLMRTGTFKNIHQSVWWP